MIAVQLTGPDLSRSPRRSTDAIERIPPADEPKITNPQFQSLDPDIISKAIPTFFIGQNSDGFWVVREAAGRNGGIFLFKDSARWFAKRISRSAGCATIFPTETFELDLKNRGNRLAVYLAPLMRLATQMKRRIKNFTSFD